MSERASETVSEPGNYPWVSTRDAAAAAAVSVVGYPMFISPSGGSGGVGRAGWQMARPERWRDKLRLKLAEG